MSSDRSDGKRVPDESSDVPTARDYIWQQRTFESRFADALLHPEPAREWVSTEQSLHFLSDALEQLLACTPDVAPSELREGCAAGGHLHGPLRAASNSLLQGIEWARRLQRHQSDSPTPAAENELMTSTLPALRQEVRSLPVGETMMLPCGWWLQKPGKRRGEVESEGGGFVLLLQKRWTCAEEEDNSIYDVVVCNCDQGRHYHAQRMGASHTLQISGTLKVANVKQHRLLADSSLWLLLTLHLSQRPTNRCVARSERIDACDSSESSVGCELAVLSAGPLAHSKMHARARPKHAEQPMRVDLVASANFARPYAMPPPACSQATSAV